MTIGLECIRCQFFSGSLEMVCAVHPNGPIDDPCPDFDLCSEPPADTQDELWQPLGGAYYDGDLIRTAASFLTTEQRLEILDTHPLFTGRCPQCEMPLLETTPPRVYWDCPHCDWMDDSV